MNAKQEDPRRVIDFWTGENVGSADEPNAALIEALEAALADARAGQMCGAIIIGFDAYTVHKMWQAGRTTTATSVGALEIMKHRILENY